MLLLFNYCIIIVFSILLLFNYCIIIVFSILYLYYNESAIYLLYYYTGAGCKIFMSCNLRIAVHA